MSDVENIIFNVKPVWKLRFPSTLITDQFDADGIIIYAVQRGSLDITRNWTVLNSVEQYRQGFIAGPPDLSITIAVREHGKAFEALRRLGKTATLFDVYCDILRVSDLPGVSEDDVWMRGFEEFQGCVINREGQTIDVGDFPVREFEIMFMRHALKERLADGTDGGIFTEGDGTFPDYEYSSETKFIKLV